MQTGEARSRWQVRGEECSHLVETRNDANRVEAEHWHRGDTNTDVRPVVVRDLWCGTCVGFHPAFQAFDGPDSHGWTCNRCGDPSECDECGGMLEEDGRCERRDSHH